MNYIDIIILICVAFFIGLILFFNIKNIRNKKTSCSNFPYAKQCNKKDNENVNCNSKNLD